VSDDKGSAALHQFEQRLLDLQFGARIHAGGGLIEDQDTRIRQGGPGNGQQLALPLADVGAPLREGGMVAVRQAADELVRVGEDGGLNHLLVRRVQPAIADVLHHRVGEEKVVLEHHAQLTPEAVLAHGADVVPVDANRAGVDVVEAGEQVDHGGLAGARRPHERHRLTRAGVEADVGQDGHVGRVGKGHVLKHDVPLDSTQIHRVGGVLEVRYLVNGLEHPLGAGQG